MDTVLFSFILTGQSTFLFLFQALFFGLFVCFILKLELFLACVDCFCTLHISTHVQCIVAIVDCPYIQCWTLATHMLCLVAIFFTIPM